MYMRTLFTPVWSQRRGLIMFTTCFMWGGTTTREEQQEKERQADREPLHECVCGHWVWCSTQRSERGSLASLCHYFLCHKANDFEWWGFCVRLCMWVSVLSLNIQSSPATHIISQSDSEHSPDEALLGHKGKHRPNQRASQCVYRDVSSRVLARPRWHRTSVGQTNLNRPRCCVQSLCVC